MRSSVVEKPGATVPPQAGFRVDDLPPLEPPPPERPPRWRRPWFIALIVLVIVAAAVGAVVLLSGGDDEPAQGPSPPGSAPAEPQAAIVGDAVTGFGSDSYELTVYEGLLWVPDYSASTVFVADPQRGKVVERIELPYSSFTRLEPGFGALWTDSSTTTLARIDAQTREISEIDVPEETTGRRAFAFGEDKVWTAALDSRTVYTLDPVDLEVVGQRRFATPINDIAAGDGMLYVLDRKGVLRFADEATGDVVAKVPVGQRWSAMEYEDGVVYVSTGKDYDAVTPVDVEERSAGAPMSLGKNMSYVEVADGRIWAAYMKDRLIRQFDAASGEQLGDAVRMPGKPLAVNIGDDGNVWAVLKNGKAFQISPDGSDVAVAREDAVVDEPAETATPAPTETATAQPSYTERARISTWWTGSDVNSDYSYAHFKAVDADGETVLDIPGSVSVDLEENLDALQETPELRALVDRLRAKLEAEGWTELGIAKSGEWYEYEFGR